MDLLRGNIKTLYFKYLSVAFGSALISSIYGIVDMAMVGQYQGPDGTAALAVVAPVWNVIYSIGLLMGIGGSVILSTKRGSGMSADGEDDQYFTAAVIGSVILAALAWVGLILFERPLLMFFGTDETLLALAQRYMIPVKVVFPLFLFNQMLAAFLRNDGAPALVTLGVLSGGIFNVFGDWFFVFPCDMGVYGAGLATALGSAVSFLVMLTHFASRKNTLRLVKPKRLARKLWKIAATGFSSFFIDMAMGILTVLFNRQIMQYLGSDALAIYGPIINVSTFVQCCAYSVGQASQPIISTNFGAGKEARIRETLRDALWTVVFFGVFWTVPSVACPNLYIRIFMSPTETILAMAPAIIRAYAISFLLLPFNIFSTYYFQAILQPKAAFIVSVARGLVISGALILMLPLLAGADSLWYAHHGACHRRLRCGVHPQIHRAARRKSHLTKRGHRRIIMAEF
jgi:MATE efflux family protein